MQLLCNKIFSDRIEICVSLGASSSFEKGLLTFYPSNFLRNSWLQQCLKKINSMILDVFCTWGRPPHPPPGLFSQRVPCTPDSWSPSFLLWKDRKKKSQDSSPRILSILLFFGTSWAGMWQGQLQLHAAALRSQGGAPPCSLRQLWL